MSAYCVYSGDLLFKDSKYLEGKVSGLTAEPDVRAFQVDKSINTVASLKNEVEIFVKRDRHIQL